MRLKNLMLVLLVGLLVLLVPRPVEASSTGGGGASFGSDTCLNCNGDWQSKFSFLLTNPFIWKTVFHYQVPLGIDCTVRSYGLGANGDELYMILFDFPERIDVGYIYISEDEKIEIYDSEGNVVTKYVTDYQSSGYGGTSNGKTFGSWIYNFVDKPYEFSHSDGFDFVVDCTDMNYEEQKQKLDEIARYLCGEKKEIPGGVTVESQKPVYDLEPPLEIHVNSKDASKDMNVSESGSKSQYLITPYKIWWHQSNIDLTGYETEFYVMEHGKYKTSLFSPWEDLDTGWIFSGSHVTAKYCNNSLKWHEFNFREDSNLYNLAKEKLNDEPFQVKFLNADFMVRNKKEDESGQMHYSTWVYVHTYEDGTFSVFEMKEDYELDDSPEDTDNIDKDSTNYDEEIIYDDTDNMPDVGGVSDAAKFIRVLKDLANSLGDFPDLFAQIFSFLPSWVLVCIGTLFVVIMLKGIF